MIRYSKLLRSLADIQFTSLLARSSYHTSNINLAQKCEPDPFGLAEEGNLNEIIQGIYMKPRKPKSPPKDTVSQDNVETAGGDQQAKELQDQDEMPYVAKFGKLKSRVEKDFESDISAEAIHAPHFGEIRLDSENKVKVHGQFDDDFFDPGEEKTVNSNKYERLARKSLINVKTQGLMTEEDKLRLKTPTKSYFGTGNSLSSQSGPTVGSSNIQSDRTPKFVPKEGPVFQKNPMALQDTARQVTPKMTTTSPETKIETEAKHKVKGRYKDLLADPDYKPETVAEFLKLKKMKKIAALTMESESEVKTKMSGQEVRLRKDSIERLAVNHVPKVYQLSDFNNMTHEDMWYYLKSQICFENDFLIALNKPNGVPMHTSSVDCRHKIIDFLPDFAKCRNIDEVFTCHRLDKDTSGILIMAKNPQAANAIKQKFANRTVEKLYFVITKNCPEILQGTIKIPIGEGRVPNTKNDTFRAVLKPDLQTYNITAMQKSCKEAVTRFTVMQSIHHAAFLEVRPETGITHQIRVHLAHGLGCPILGDHKYSHRDKFAPQRLHAEILDKINVKQSKVRLLPLHLHCSKMEFTMPDGFMSKPWNEPIFVHASPPKFFMNTLRALRMMDVKH